MSLPSPRKAAPGPLSSWSALQTGLAFPILLASCTDMGADPSERSSSLEHALPARPDEDKIQEDSSSSSIVWSGKAWLEPLAGTYFGANLDFHHDTMSGFNGRLGHNAADYV